MSISSNITMRIDPIVLKRIDQAARIKGKTRSAFMIDLALQEAENILPDFDQTHFVLSSTDHQTLMQRLEQEPDQDKLNRLLISEGLPWVTP